MHHDPYRPTTTATTTDLVLAREFSAAGSKPMLHDDGSVTKLKLFSADFVHRMDDPHVLRSRRDYALLREAWPKPTPGATSSMSQVYGVLPTAAPVTPTGGKSTSRSPQFFRATTATPTTAATSGPRGAGNGAVRQFMAFMSATSINTGMLDLDPVARSQLTDDGPSRRDIDALKRRAREGDGTKSPNPASGRLSKQDRAKGVSDPTLPSKSRQKFKASGSSSTLVRAQSADARSRSRGGRTESPAAASHSHVASGTTSPSSASLARLRHDSGYVAMSLPVYAPCMPAGQPMAIMPPDLTLLGSSATDARGTPTAQTPPTNTPPAGGRTTTSAPTTGRTRPRSAGAVSTYTAGTSFAVPRLYSASPTARSMAKLLLSDGTPVLPPPMHLRLPNLRRVGSMFPTSPPQTIAVPLLTPGPRIDPLARAAATDPRTLADLGLHGVRYNNQSTSPTRAGFAPAEPAVAVGRRRPNAARGTGPARVVGASQVASGLIGMAAPGLVASASMTMAGASAGGAVSSKYDRMSSLPRLELGRIKL
ncbi:hypothetical protein AMAG_00293 [Allomyces macrogynus ATCC 38327]|uniref:Uncharacterized protein n=1 Tax=Allomyces macrogynus (strain ATCC 38327) TaxID=578462 RepID=A0A0L0RV39_ALLM3|nr:hypothetical protein AMAG_00293 [Allomyces macrogynus ATCC 38327]|eukprot:KNE54312.1 hypothetical protein AMAG_00293 [Allomyces macrogynus ATCC 38327]